MPHYSLGLGLGCVVLQTMAISSSGSGKAPSSNAQGFAALSVTPETDLRRPRRDRCRAIMRVRSRTVFDRSLPSTVEDHVSGLQPCGLRPGESVGDFGDQGTAASLVQVETLGQVLGEWLDVDAEPAAFDPAVCPAVRIRSPGPWSEGMAKPIPMLPPLGEKIAVFTPITSPSCIKRRPAGIAAVDRARRSAGNRRSGRRRCCGRSPRRCPWSRCSPDRRGCRR